MYEIDSAYSIYLLISDEEHALQSYIQVSVTTTGLFPEKDLKDISVLA